MQSIKTPYYPNKQLYMRRTQFGSVIIFPESDIYDKPIAGKIIVKVDAVKYLEKLWGSAAVRCRELAYRVVGGDCSNELYIETITSMYVRFSGFANYIDMQWKFGNSSDSDITKIVKPARDFVDKTILSIKEKFDSTGGKFLLCTHDYAYASYSHGNIPSIQHSEVIKC